MKSKQLPKIHFRAEAFDTICGVHRSTRIYQWRNNQSEVTCGNCIRKLSVFKWTPDSSQIRNNDFDSPSDLSSESAINL